MSNESDTNRSRGESSPEADDRMDAAQANTSWKKDDHILCKWQDNFFYEGKIHEVTENEGQLVYHVRYPGWGKKFDELIAEDDVVYRFQPFSEQKNKEEMEKIKEARSSAKSKKRKSSIDTPSAEKKVGSETPVSKKVKRTAKSSESKPRKKLPGSVIQSPLISAKTPVRKQSVKKETSDGANISANPIKLTPNLKGIMETDLNIINDKDMLPSLPARFTVQIIINQYIDRLNEELNKLAEEGDNERSESNRLQANKISAQMLLANFTEDVVSKVVLESEQPMFKDLFAGKSGYGGIAAVNAESEKGLETKDISAKLGIVYLLRVLAELHKLIGAEKYDKENTLDDFVRFLDEHAGEFYLGREDYYVASIEYIGTVGKLEQEKRKHNFLQ